YLDGMTLGGGWPLFRQVLALGDPDLPFHQVHAGDALGDRVLDLQAGIHLQEHRGMRPLLVDGDEELHGARTDVTDGLGHAAGRFVQALPQVVGQARCRGLLHDLLVAALDGTVAFADRPHHAVSVGQDLHLDVSASLDVGLTEDGGVTERRGGLATGRGHLVGQCVPVTYHAHAAPTTTGGRLDQYGKVFVADLVEFQGGRDRHSGLAGDLFGTDLGAHLLDRLGRWADPGQSRIGHGAGEAGVLGQETVP